VPVVGCLVRLVLVIALLVVLAIGAVIALVGSGAVRGWVVEVGQSTGVMTGVPAQTERGIAAYEAGDVARAERELREAAQLYPRSPLAPLYLGRIRLEAGDVERAGEYLRAAVSRDPASAAAHRELGAYYAARAESAESRDGNGAAARLDLLDAAREYGRALELDPRDDVARGAYGCTLAALGRADESDEVLAPLGGIATCAAR
jgi:Tfp pilus assembly protein PilF